VSLPLQAKAATKGFDATSPRRIRHSQPPSPTRVKQPRHSTGSRKSRPRAYRPSRNPLVDELFKRVRKRSAPILIPKDALRRVVRTLRRGMPVWYAPDQSHRRAQSALIPFFGEPAMTSTGLSELARLGNAVVVPLFPTRLPDGRGYRLDILPALEDFPGASPEDDARRVNAILEAHIRKVPEQYYWLHRRFKGRPEGYADPYSG
jgi:KDO2-lipid IV(A) lauroyltransferase